MNSENQYDAIAEATRSRNNCPSGNSSKPTLFKILGDIRGATVLDLACGDGFYTRRIKQAEALEVTGLDLSGEMISLAGEEERARPLGCRYLQGDAAGLELSGQVGSPREGDVILYKMTGKDGTTCEFKNYYLEPETYRWAFRKAGFLDFQWAGPYLHPAERHNRKWHGFMSRPPVIGFKAEKPQDVEEPRGAMGDLHGLQE